MAASPEQQVIAEAASIEEMALTPGWRLFSARLEALRQEAHLNTLNHAGEAVGGQWRIKLATLDTVIGLVDDYRQARQAAVKELDFQQTVAGIVS